jgi:hypothetical protein
MKKPTFNTVYSRFIEQSDEPTHTKEELEAIITDLSSMIDNPEVKLSKEQIVAKLKGYINQLNDTPENKLDMEYLASDEPVMESKKKVKKDNCYRKAKAKYDVFPSAYASGYISKCRKRKGKIK